MTSSLRLHMLHHSDLQVPTHPGELLSGPQELLPVGVRRDR